MKLFLCALAAGLCVSALALGARADDVVAPIQALVARQAPAVVTVRAVLKVSVKGEATQTAESRTEMQGVVVDPSGLVMISNVAFSPAKLMEMMGMPADATGLMPAISPSDFKVIFSNEEKEYPAFVAASDATLGLTFLKIADLGGRTLTAVVFGAAPPPALGEQVYGVSRLSKGYDYAPFVENGRVIGAITKPRPALMLDGEMSELGAPVFSQAGDPVGVLTSVSSGVKDEGGDASFGMQMMMRALGGGGGRSPGVFLVPGSAISPVIAQALARAAVLGDKAAAPVPPPAPKPVPPAAK